MSWFHAPPGRLPVFCAGLVFVLGAASCSHGPTSAQDQVKHAFTAWKTEILNRQTDQAMAYIPHNVSAYLNALNSDAATPGSAAPARPALSPTPGVDRLLRTALEKKVPPDLRAGLTLDLLVQRITARRLFNPRDLRQVDLGRISVNGDHASAEIYFQGSLTALQLPFMREDGVWKIDVLAILPSAELLMRVDRAIKGENESEQVDQLVNKLPSL
jgi:hypothetical protein